MMHATEQANSWHPGAFASLGTSQSAPQATISSSAKKTNGIPANYPLSPSVRTTNGFLPHQNSVPLDSEITPVTDSNFNGTSPQAEALPSNLVRNIVLPLLKTNANLREFHLEDGAAQTAFTDDVCDSFASAIVRVQKQLESREYNTASNVLDSAPHDSNNHPSSSRNENGMISPNSFRRSFSSASVDTSISQMNGLDPKDEHSRNPPSKRRRIDNGNDQSLPPQLRRTSSNGGSLHNHDPVNGIVSPSSSFVPPKTPETILANYSDPHIAFRPSPSPLHKRHEDDKRLRSRSRTPSFQSNGIHRHRSSSSVRSVDITQRASTRPTSPPHLTPRPTLASNVSSLKSLGDGLVSLPKSNRSEVVDDTDITMIDAPDIKAQTQVQELPPLCHGVPGIWAIQMGLTTPGIMEFEFDLDLETAIKWNIKKSDADNEIGQQSMNQNQKLAIHLLSLPVELVASTLPNVHSQAQEPSNTWMSLHAWPPQGSLLLEVNHGTSISQSWLPQSLGPENMPLNITSSIHLGKNTIRCIQLSSLCHFFVICATVVESPAPPPLPLLPPPRFAMLNPDQFDDASDRFSINIEVDHG